MKLLNSTELEQVVGGQGYCDGFKALHKAVFWADKKKPGETYLDSKKRQIKAGWNQAGSNGAKAGIVATDGAILAAGALACTTGIAGSVFGAVKLYANKAKNKVVNALS